MTRLAKRHAVVRVCAKLWMLCVAIQVVRVHARSTNSADAAGVVVTLQNGLPPLTVFRVQPFVGSLLRRHVVVVHAIVRPTQLFDAACLAAHTFQEVAKGGHGLTAASAAILHVDVNRNVAVFQQFTPVAAVHLADRFKRPLRLANAGWALLAILEVRQRHLMQASALAEIRHLGFVVGVLDGQQRAASGGEHSHCIVQRHTPILVSCLLVAAGLAERRLQEFGKHTGALLPTRARKAQRLLVVGIGGFQQGAAVVGKHLLHQFKVPGGHAENPE